jgi:hypothetical protein
MTFVEELKQLSEKVELKHKVDRQLAELKTKMKTAATNGYRYFKIEIFTIITEVAAAYLPTEIKADNYYGFYTGDGAFYANELFAFLAELGFDTSELKCVQSSNLLSGYTSLSITVGW